MRGTLALVLGLAVVASCGSDSTGTTPSVSGVFPSMSFTGRAIRVEVSGDATNFAAGATIDFGPGITASNITVASPTDLFADLAIDGAADLGPRDVVVHNGSDSFTLAKSFELISPVVVKTSGTLAQGSVAQVSIQNLDFGSPFDATCGFSFFGQCFQYTNTSVTLGTGVTVQVSFVDDYHITGTMFIDTDAAGGALAVTSGASGAEITSQAGDPVDIATRTATALGTTPAAVAVPHAGDSALLSFTSTGASVARAVFDTQDPANQSTVYILPASGHFADMLTRASADANGVITANVVTKTGGSYFAVYADDGFQDAVTANTANIALTTTVAEAEANNTTGTAQVGTAPMLFDAASLSSSTDLDYVKLTVAAGDAGKSIHVVTGGDDPFTDTVVDVFSSNGTTSLGGPSDDSDFHENFTSSAISAGINYVQISASSVFDAAHKNYIAAIWIE